MVCIIDAARYLIYLSHVSHGHVLTHLKLQKLLYLAQGWSFVWDDKPVFSEFFEAWQYGPVNRCVYNEFKKYSNNIIPEIEGRNDSVLGADTDAKGTLDAIWKEYGRLSAYQLVELTHSQRPWQDAYYHNKSISNSSIKAYFQSTYQ